MTEDLEQERLVAVLRDNSYLAKYFPTIWESQYIAKRDGHRAAETEKLRAELKRRLKIQ